MYKRWKQILDSPYPTLMFLRLLVMICMVSVYFFMPNENAVFVALAIVLFIVSYYFIGYSKNKPWIFFMIELMIALAMGYISVGSDSPYRLLIGLVGCGLFLYYEGKVLYISWSILFVLLIVYELFFDVQDLAQVLVDYSFIVFASLIGGLIRYSYQTKNRFRLLYQELDSSYQKLQEHSQTVERLAMEEERNRITREIHDTVGHTVTALIFQLEAARKLMNKDPQKSYEIMKTGEGLARSIYQEIRFSIETNDQEAWEEVELHILLQKLINDFSRLTQLEIKYQMEGTEPASFSRQHKLSLYRILQETLTNAKRHGLAKKVWISLVFDEQEVEFIIKDNGIGADQLNLGYGLKNLQKRVQDLGGTCYFCTKQDKGFRTEIKIPLTVGKGTK